MYRAGLILPYSREVFTARSVYAELEPVDHTNGGASGNGHGTGRSASSASSDGRRDFVALLPLTKLDSLTMTSRSPQHGTESSQRLDLHRIPDDKAVFACQRCSVVVVSKLLLGYRIGYISTNNKCRLCRMSWSQKRSLVAPAGPSG